jgi:hypothetical protein
VLTCNDAQQKGAMESELAALKAGGAVTAPASVTSKDRDRDKGAAAGEEEIKKLNDELERVSMQLVTASLGHAQAEQDRLEAKQQVGLAPPCLPYVMHINTYTRKFAGRHTSIHVRIVRTEARVLRRCIG